MEKRNKSSRRISLPLYPFLFGLFPVLSLAAANLSQIELRLTYRSVLFSIALSALLFAVTWLIFRSRLRSAFVTFLLLLLFYTYGHIYNLLQAANILGAASKGEIPLAIAWLVLAVGAVWLSGLKRLDLNALTLFLNLFAAVLLIYPLFQVARFSIEHRPRQAGAPGAPTPQGKPSPDIYYIILDAYDRLDTMKMVYDYDNSSFVEALTRRGFYVAPCSQSNYAYTQSSLASSLNLDYLDSLGVTSNATADPLLQDNAVRRFLKSRGYTIVAFETGFSWSQWEDADVYYRYHPKAGVLNGFEVLFLRITLARLPLDLFQAKQEAIHGQLPHDRVIYVLDTLKQVPAAVKGPKFVFVHLSIPHPPFVFGPLGELVTAGAENATSVPGYRNSVTFINSAILQVVDSILANSAQPPIIILQGDHGAPLYHTPEERMSILNAYYLPGGAGDLSPEISPVNTFRLVFDRYFGQHYPLLPDVSQYSPTNRTYDFAPIPNECTP